MLKNKLLSAMGGAPANYIEEVFSTWLYTGNGSTQTITNGIDLAGKGGLVWIKGRQTAFSHVLVDTVRGPTKYLSSNNTTAELTAANTVPSFSSTGFTAGTDNQVNLSGDPFVSWTFRKQAKFFDVVTYTGDDNFSGRQIAHNLGSVPGCILIKKTSGAKDWEVWHRSLTDGAYVQLNSTAAQTGAGGFDYFGASATQTATYFTLGDLNDDGVNRAGATYVAYLFAHNAGGFGLTGTDNVISCGSSVGGGSAGDVTVNLGYEPQWVLLKNITTTNAALGPWILIDNMRGYFAPTTGENYLRANASNAEATGGFWTSHPTATGFTHYANAGESYIYIAIRRGPMKVPTTGTSVFAPVARAGTNSVANVTSGFPTDLFINLNRDHLYFANNPFFDRLRGLVYSNSNSTATETDGSPFLSAYGNTGVTLTNSGLNNSATTYITYSMGRAPGFFDEVCYTGDGVNGRTVSHNLTVAPELIMVKNRSASADWAVYANGPVGCLILNATNGANGIANFPVGTPTTTTFAVASSSGVNGSGNALVAYLFATCPGVSKVGSYTGTGSPLTINCGFTGGARFVMIKRTDSTGDWYVWDSARGIVAGNDPYLLLNSTAAEVTSTDYVDTFAAGFELTVTAPAAINASGGTFIFLAIA